MVLYIASIVTLRYLKPYKRFLYAARDYGCDASFAIIYFLALIMSDPSFAEENDRETLGWGIITFCILIILANFSVIFFE